MPALMAQYRGQLQTGAYFAALVGLGLADAALGPTLPGLAMQTGVTIGAISVLFTARSLGYLCGSLLSGRLYDRLPGHAVMAAAALLLSAMLVLVPHAPMFWTLVGIACGWGFAESGLDVGSNALLVWVHGSAVAPYMNALHFCYGLGALLSPIIVARMLAASGSHASAYSVLAVLMLPVSLVVLLPSPRPPAAAALEHGGGRPPGLLPLIVTFFFLHVAAEASFGGWIYTYALRRGLADEAGAAYLTAAYWGALTAGRLLSILLSARVRPRTLLAGGLVGALASLAMIAARPADATALWLGAGRHGALHRPHVCHHSAAGRAAHAHYGRNHGLVFCGQQLRRDDLAVHHRAAVSMARSANAAAGAGSCAAAGIAGPGCAAGSLSHPAGFPAGSCRVSGGRHGTIAQLQRQNVVENLRAAGIIGRQNFTRQADQTGRAAETCGTGAG